MDRPSETKKKLVLPTALAVAVLASGCGGGNPTPGNDAAQNDAAIADAGMDAGCVPPEVYDPTSGMCVPLV
ncbi:MAG: hypothetical protein U0234_23530 [Sandaracinus sp.]